VNRLIGVLTARPLACDTARMYEETGQFPTVYLKLVSSHRAASPGDCIRLRVDGTDAGSMVRGGMLQLERDSLVGWEKVYTLLSGRSPSAAPTWESYGASGRFGVTLIGVNGAAPLYVHVPPVAPGDYRFRLGLTHSNHEIGDIKARTVTLYAPLRVILPDGREG
jgi:hypothetical protein